MLQPVSAWPGDEKITRVEPAEAIEIKACRPLLDAGKLIIYYADFEL
jgi:hypothetical protein